MDTATAPTLASLRKRRDAILDIFQKHGCSNVRVFGSVARGTSTTDSDIDFLCDYDRSRRTPWFPAGLIVDLEKYLGSKADVAFNDLLNAPGIGPQIAEDAVPL